MSEKPRQRKNIIGGSGKGNYQIWVIIAVIGSLILFTYMNNSNSAKPISKRKFEDMVRSNDVERVVLVKNKDIVEVYLSPEALESARYKMAGEK